MARALPGGRIVFGKYASEDEAVFDENLKRLAKAKPGPKRKEDE